MEADDRIPKPWVREKALVGDASHRRYARIWDRQNHTAVIARYPRGVRSQMVRDLEVRAWCAARGLRVPALLDHDLGQGWIVVEDFGPDDAEVYLHSTPPGERCGVVRRLLAPLERFARIEPSELPAWNRPLDGSRLRWELAGFELWFVRHYLETPPSPAVGRWLDELAAAIDTHPRRVCHRDYHLNNLYFLDDGAIGLIDFQDLLVGPDTYDGVSLLGERGLPLLLDDQERVQVQRWWAGATCARPGWQERWPLVGAQRALKALGTFARLVVGGGPSYEKWLQNLAYRTAPELASLRAPSELVDLLLDLSRRHRPTAAG